MTKKAPPEKIEKPALPVMGDAVPLYGIMPPGVAEVRVAHKRIREATETLRDYPDVTRKLVRTVESAIKSAAGSAPKRPRETQTAELLKIIAGVQRSGVKSGKELYAKVQAIAQAREPPIPCSVSTIKAAMKGGK